MSKAVLFSTLLVSLLLAQTAQTKTDDGHSAIFRSRRLLSEMNSSPINSHLFFGAQKNLFSPFSINNININLLPAAENLRFRTLQASASPWPAACDPRFVTLATSCPDVVDQTKWTAASGWATQALRDKNCAAGSQCTTLLNAAFQCWADNATTAKPAPPSVVMIATVDVCPASGSLVPKFNLPAQCQATFGPSCSFADAQALFSVKVDTLPVLPSGAAGFCDAGCFSKVLPTFDCLIAAKWLDPATPRPTQTDLDSANSLFCSKGLDGSRCYSHFRQYRLNQCVDPPDFSLDKSAVGRWAAATGPGGQADFCSSGCGALQQRGILCLAQAGAVFSGKKVVVSPADAAFLDLLCIKAEGKFCLTKANAFDAMASKTLSTLTKADLDSVCDACAKRVVDRLIVAGVPGLVSNSAVLKVACLRELGSGDYCATTLPPEIKAWVDNSKPLEQQGSKVPSEATLKNICGSRCTKRFLQALIDLDVILAQNANPPLTAAQLADKNAARVEAEKALTFMCFASKAGKFCLNQLSDPTLYGPMLAACPSLAIVNKLQRPVQGGSAGTMGPQSRPSSGGLPAPKNFNQGLGDITSTPTVTCSAACSSALKTFAAAQGCCFGLQVDIIRQLADADQTIPADWVAPYTSEFVSVLTTCGADPSSAELVSCAKPQGTKVATVTVSTSLSPSLTNNTAVKSAVESDICSQLTTTTTLPSNCRVTSVVPTPAATATATPKVFSALQDTSAPVGTTFTFSIQGPTDAVTDSFSKDATTALARNEISLDQTNAQLQASTGDRTISGNLDASQATAEATVKAAASASATAKNTATGLAGNLALLSSCLIFFVIF